MNQDASLPALTDEELANPRFGVDKRLGVRSLDTQRLIADLRTAKERIKELEQNQVTHEYDEDTGYCLCHCCDHGI